MTWFVVGVCAVGLCAVVGLGVAARRRVLVVQVDGVSMDPTLHPDDRVVARRRPPPRLRSGDVVVGDNPAFSDDSRRFGAVSGDGLIGVVVRRVGGGPVAPAPAYDTTMNLSPPWPVRTDVTWPVSTASGTPRWPSGPPARHSTVV